MRRDVDRIEQEMLALAFVDPVSGLDNRHAVRLDLAGHVARADAGLAGAGFSVVSLALDNFKAINDTLGHHVGHQVLQEVAQRLDRAVQPGTKACRLGGDEFVVVCPCGIGYQDPAAMARW